MRAESNHVTAASSQATGKAQRAGIILFIRKPVERNQLADTRRPDTRKIESTAVQAVRNLIQQCDTLHHNIDEEDKHPVVDGTIELYSGTPQIKENLVGEVTVQVKGTTRKMSPNKRGFIKYSMDVVDLRRFLDVFHGVLLFCVAVEKDGLAPKQVYYANLLPYELNKILAKAGDTQKKASVRIRQFPSEPREVKRLISQFHHEYEEQLEAKVSGYGFLDDSFELPPGIKSFSFSSQLFPGENVVSLAGLGAGPYVYGTTTDGRKLVIGKIGDVSMFGVGSERTVSSGGFKQKTMVFVGDQREGMRVEFEGVSMLLSERDNKATLNWSISGDFRRRYNTARFVLEFLRAGALAIDGHRILRIEPQVEEDETTRRLEETVGAYRPFVETLDTMGIAAKWDPEKMSGKELNDMGLMHRLLVEGKPLDGREIKSPVVHFDIQGAQIYALARKRDEGGYGFVDILSDKLFFVFGYSDQEAPHKVADPVPALMALGEEEFRKVVNLKPQNFAEQLDRFPITAGNQSPLNQKVLEMLSAYDKGAQQPDALLACAATLAKKLHEFDNRSETYLLNLMQTIKRRRTLEDGEKDELRDLVIDTSERCVQAAAYALLDEKDMARRCLDHCSAAERRQIEDYPISLFFKEG